MKAEQKEKETLQEEKEASEKKRKLEEEEKLFALSELKIARETNSNLQAAMENSRQENAKEVKRAAEEADRRWTMEDGRRRKSPGGQQKRQQTEPEGAVVGI